MGMMATPKKGMCQFKNTFKKFGCILEGKLKGCGEKMFQRDEWSNDLGIILQKCNNGFVMVLKCRNILRELQD